jgi:hypothetical protein
MTEQHRHLSLGRMKSALRVMITTLTAMSEDSAEARGSSWMAALQEHSCGSTNGIAQAGKGARHSQEIVGRKLSIEIAPAHRAGSLWLVF